MSDQPETTAAPEIPEEKPPEEKKKDGPRPKKPLRRRLLKWTLIVVAVLVVLRLALPFVLPVVLDQVAGSFDLDVEYDDLSLSLLGGEVEIRGLVVTTSEDGEEFARLNYARADLRMWRLLHGDIHLQRVDVDGIDLHLRRAADGSLPVLDRFKSEDPTPDEPEPEEEEEVEEPEPESDVDYSLPVKIDDFMAVDIRAHIVDEAVTPTLSTTVHVSSAVSGLGIAERQSTLTLVVRIDGILGSFRIDGNLDQMQGGLAVHAKAAVTGLRMAPVASHLARLGMEPRAEETDLQATIGFRLLPDPERTGEGRAELEITDVRARSDGRAGARLGLASVVARGLGSDTLVIEEVGISDVFARFAVDAEGSPIVLGVAFTSPPEEAEAAAAPEPEPDPVEPPVPDPADPKSKGPNLVVSRVAIERVLLDLRDDSQETPIELLCILEHLEAANLSSDPEAEPGSLDLLLTAKTLVREFALRGTVSPLSGRPKAALDLSVTGLTPAPIRPWIRMIGLDPDFERGDIRAQLGADLGAAEGGGVTANFAVDNFMLKADNRIHRIGSIRVDDFVAGGDVAVGFGEVTISGVNSELRLDADGQLHIPGFRLVSLPRDPTDDATDDEPAPAPAPAPAPPGAPRPREPVAVEFGRVILTDNFVRFHDATVEPESTIELRNFSVDAGMLRIDMAAGIEPVEAKITLRAPGIAEEISISGTVASPGDGLDLDLDVKGRDIDLTSLAPWLRAGGIDPRMQDGELDLRLAGEIRFGADGTRMDVRVADVTVREGEEEYFRCGEVALSGFEAGAEGIHIERITGRDPSLQVRWDKREVRLLGIAVGGAPPPAEAPIDGASIVGSQADEPVATAEDGPGSETTAGGEPRLTIGEVAFTGGSLSLWNRERKDSEEIHLFLDLESDGIEVQGDAARAGFDAKLTVPETGALVNVSGRVTKGGPKVHAELGVSGEKIGGERLSTLFPPGVSFSLEEGRLSTKVTVDLDTPKPGVQAARILVEDVVVAEGADEVPVFAFDRLAMDMEMLKGTEEKAEELRIAELSLAGLEGEFRMRSDGTIRFLGISISPTPEETEPAPSTEEGNGKPEAAGKEPKARPDAGPRLEAFMKTRENPPRVRIEKLHCAVNRVSVIDETPGAETLVIEDIVLTNPEPIDTSREDQPGHAAPINLALSAKASRFIERFEVRADVRPFSQPPSAEVRVDIGGIHGGQIMEALPSLAESVDLSHIENGRFAAMAEVKLRYRGNAKLDFDLSRGFDLEVDDVILESGRDEPPLLSIDSISASVTRLRPDRVEISTVEIVAPRARIVKQKEGIRVLGVLLRQEEAAPAEDDSVAAESPPAGETAPEPLEDAPPAEPAPPPDAPQTEISIGTFYVSDLAIDVRDESVDPILHMPIMGTEIEVRGITTKMTADSNAVRFQLFARSAKTSLPSEPDRERPAFDEIAVLGQLGFEPHLRGWLRASVMGLDLSNLRGMAKESGVTLNRGTLELGVGARFHDDGGMRINSTIAFRDLNLTEPEGGVLQRLLKLPASTNTVIFLLRDHTGTISFSFGLDIPPEQKVSTRRITSLAITKISELIALAVLKSPLRVGAGIAGIVGIGPGEEEPEDPILIAFEPGTTRLTEDSRSAFEALIERMQDESDLTLTLEHEIGTADLEPVETRATPRQDDCRAIAEHLRLRQRRILEERATVVERARAYLVAGRAEESGQARKQLRAIDREIGNIARELDQVLAILRRGADRRKTRRTQLGCVALGRMRIEELARRMRAAKVQPDRIRYLRPRYADPEIEDGGIVSLQPGRRMDAERPTEGEVPEGTKPKE